MNWDMYILWGEKGIVTPKAERGVAPQLGASWKHFNTHMSSKRIQREFQILITSPIPSCDVELVGDLVHEWKVTMKGRVM